MIRRVFSLLVLIALAVAMFSEAHAARATAFFEMLRHTKGQFHGQPFTLLPWQRQIIRDVYGTLKEDGTRQYKYVYIEIPKKNGKSELAAAAALYHLFMDGELTGEIYGCAADRDQASLVFDVAVGMIDQSPALQKRAKVVASQKKIIDRKTGSIYRAESAEAYTKHGLNLSACIFDELHAQPNRQLWDVMTFGAGDARRQPIWWIITTAGDDPDRVSVGWEQHEYASKILAGEILDPTWYPVIYGYDGTDIWSEESWAQANPSLGATITVESLREAAQRAKTKPAEERLFRWLRLNQWLTSKLTTWLPLDLFDSTIGTWNRTEQLGRDCYLGLDLSTTTDLSAICLVFPPQDTQLDWRAMWEAWIPKENMQERVERDHVPYDRWAESGWVTLTEGDVIDYTAIEEKIVELSTLYNIKEVVADPAFATMLLQRLELVHHMTVVTVPQTFVNLTDPMNQVEVLLKTTAKQQADDLNELKKQLAEELKKHGVTVNLSVGMTHEPSATARWCFGNTSIAKNGGGLIKYVKEHKGKSVVRTKRIDLVAAWITAMCRARFYKGNVDLSAQVLDPEWGM